MQAFKHAVPTMIGGAADLVESTYTEFEGGGIFSDAWAGRNIAFGIREHAMGSIVNGIAVHGGCVKPYGSTFLIFSDYMRPAVRLSALMGLPVVWAWTHDSVGLGEDGPTHQPVETYAALRAIPNLWFVRPADANETAWAWKVALDRQDGPVALSLSRQKVPTLDRTELAPASGLERGAYTLWESASSPDLILIATGAEVGLALEAGEEARRRRAPRCASSRCRAGSCSTRSRLTTATRCCRRRCGARLSIEPGVELGWSRWVGDRGDVDLDRALRRVCAGSDGPGAVRLQPRQRGCAGDRAPRARDMNQAEVVKTFLSLVSPGFCMEGELPAVQLEGIEVRLDGHAVAMVQADGRTLPLRFTFDEGRIARVEIL